MSAKDTFPAIFRGNRLKTKKSQKVPFAPIVFPCTRNDAEECDLFAEHAKTLPASIAALFLGGQKSFSSSFEGPKFIATLCAVDGN